MRLEQGQHSQLVGRGKYVHEKITHAVHPGQRDEYLKAAEAYFTTLQKESASLGNVKLCGSWETIIGAVGNFTHILEYEGYAGYDETRRKSLKNEVGRGLVHLTSAPPGAAEQGDAAPAVAPAPDYPGVLVHAVVAAAR